MKRKIELSLLVVFLSVIVITSVKLVFQYCDYSKGVEEYGSLAEDVLSADTLSTSFSSLRQKKYFDDPVFPQTTSEGMFTIPLSTDKFHRFTIDFAQLDKINPDTVGWITIPNTPCSYPILKGSSNDEYLSKTIYGTNNSAGSIFMETSCKSDFSSHNTIIYGHNMKNDTMFHTINKYKEESFFKEHPYIYVMTPDGVERIYHLVSCFKTTSDSFVYKTDFTDSKEYNNYLSSIVNSSLYMTNPCDTTKPIITLSTCTGINGTERFVVILQLLTSV